VVDEAEQVREVVASAGADLIAQAVVLDDVNFVLVVSVGVLDELFGRYAWRSSVVPTVNDCANASRNKVSN
jgi:hypothetical protein